MKTRSMILAISTILLGQATFAQEGLAARDRMEPGVYYGLSEKLAQHLGIDYRALVASAQLQDGEKLVAKRNEEDGEINIAIFDNHNFASARADILQGQ